MRVREVRREMYIVSFCLKGKKVGLLFVDVEMEIEGREGMGWDRVQVY